MGASVSWERRRTCEWRYWAVSKHLVRDAFFVLYFSKKGRREVEKNALVWLGSIYYPVCAPVHGPPGLYPRGSMGKSVLLLHRSHFRKKDHDFEEIMVVEVVSP